MNAYERPRTFAGHLVASVASGLAAMGLTTSAQAHTPLMLVLILALFGMAVSPMYVWRGPQPALQGESGGGGEGSDDPNCTHKLIASICLTGAAGMILLGLAGGAFGGLSTILLTVVGGSYATVWLQQRPDPIDNPTRATSDPSTAPTSMPSGKSPMTARLEPFPPQGGLPKPADTPVFGRRRA